MVNTNMTTIRIEMPIESYLVAEINSSTGREDLTIRGGHGQLTDRATTAIRNVCD